MTASRRMLIYIAGSPWDGVLGTDRQLTTALSHSVPVLWVDPPMPVVGMLCDRVRKARGRGSIGLDVVAPNICRLRVLGPPGLTRTGMRSISSWWLSRQIATTVQNLRGDAHALVLATPEGRFPSNVDGVRVYYVTDDWPAGAELMGLSRRRIKRLEAANLHAADVVAAVSPFLLDKVTSDTSKPSKQVMLANGCDPQRFCGPSPGRPADVPQGGFAVMVGQVNERLDLAAARAVADLGMQLVVIGPRTERDAGVAAELDELFMHPNVSWLGRREAEELPAYLRAASVGLTPYLDTAFNRASFPLKTLEYLAAGLPVVSTDLPATRWLDTDLVTIAGSPEEFAAKAKIMAEAEPDMPSSRVLDRQEFARTHSWDSRATELLSAL